MRHGSHDDPVKPSGYRKAKSRLRIARSPIYLPVTTVDKAEQSLWLSANRVTRGANASI